MAEFESAVLASYVHDANAPLALADESATSKTLVRSDRSQFSDLTFGHCSMVSGALVAATRPDEWLLLGDAAVVAEAEGAIDTGGFTSVIPFTHGRTVRCI